MRRGGFVVAAGVLVLPACSSGSERNLTDTASLRSTAVSALLKVPIGTSPVRGPADAWVTLVEFGDFECPACGWEEPILRNLLQEYPKDLRLVFKNFPLTDIHPWAEGAALAAGCALPQGGFWQMHDLLFANQTALDAESLVIYANTAGLDVGAWRRCMVSSPPAQVVAADLALGTSLEVDATPTFVLNGVRIVGTLSQSRFEYLINQAGTAAAATGVSRSRYYDQVVLGQ
ncbi:MAG TPA: DsbA family protein [Polyangiaceae bacterium]|nr:DsbA family protein [Polyangiaceae bacterium]